MQNHHWNIQCAAQISHIQNWSSLPDAFHRAGISNANFLITQAESHSNLLSVSLSFVPPAVSLVSGLSSLLISLSLPYSASVCSYFPVYSAFRISPEYKHFSPPCMLLDPHQLFPRLVQPLIWLLLLLIVFISACSKRTETLSLVIKVCDIQCL